MVRELASPRRPLGGCDQTWTWLALEDFPDAGDENQNVWLRVFHQGDRCRTPTTRRGYGPLYRFDHHSTPFDDPAADRSGAKVPARLCPEGRSIIYLARSLPTALAEVFDDLGHAAICPFYRVAALRVTKACQVLDLTGSGCVQLGALPSLGSGSEPRPLTQRWARAIYEDDPTGSPIGGILYRSAHDYGHCLALFDRCPELMEETAGHPSGGIRLVDIKPRVQQAMMGIRIPYREIDSKACTRCHDS